MNGHSVLQTLYNMSEHCTKFIVGPRGGPATQMYRCVAKLIQAATGHKLSVTGLRKYAADHYTKVDPVAANTMGDHTATTSANHYRLRNRDAEAKAWRDKPGMYGTMADIQKDHDACQRVVSTGDCGDSRRVAKKRKLNGSDRHSAHDGKRPKTSRMKSRTADQTRRGTKRNLEKWSYIELGTQVSKYQREAVRDHRNMQWRAFCLKHKEVMPATTTPRGRLKWNGSRLKERRGCCWRRKFSSFRRLLL